MAKLCVHADRVEIELTTVEKALSFRRSNIVLSRGAIQKLVITAEPWGWIRGVHSPGTVVPHAIAYGTWKFRGGSDFLLIKGRARRAVVIDMLVDAEPSDPEAAHSSPLQPFSRLIVSTEHAAQLVAVLRRGDHERETPLVATVESTTDL